MTTKRVAIPVLILVLALSAIAWKAPSSGCLPAGSYIFASSGSTISWYKMSSGLVTNDGSYDLEIGSGVSPNGRFAVNRCALVFSWAKPGQMPDLYRIPIKGGWSTQLTNSADIGEMDPMFSPDGSVIYYSAYTWNSQNTGRMDRSGANANSLYMEDGYAPAVNSIDGSLITSVKNFPAYTGDWSVFTPDGKAVVSHGGDNLDLFILNGTGGVFASSARYVAFRPEGSLAAVVLDNGDLEIVVVNSNWVPTKIVGIIAHNVSFATWVNVP